MASPAPRRARARRGSPQAARHVPGAWQELRDAAGAVSVFAGVLEDAAGRAWFDLLETLGGRSPAAARVAAAYGRLFTLLAGEVELARESLVGDAWQHHLLARILEDENPFSQKAERAEFPIIGQSLLSQTRADLLALQRCHRLGGTALGQAVGQITGAPVASLDGFRPLSRGGPRSAQHQMMERLAQARDWGGLARDLAAYFAVNGAGVFGRYRAFRWVHLPGGGRLEGIPFPDPVRLDDLVGYETERQPVVDNTRQFVAGMPANNVLIYGDRGTGKSSTVKALFNEFLPKGLRLIEVAKEDLGDYAQILAPLRGRRERFVLFIDDLSFEEHETQYKALKAALEGSLETRPENVVVYATSNRRRLVRERFSDRRGPALDEDDVHLDETVQEKLSFADRFGIHAPFLFPDQDRYLQIAEALAGRYGLHLPAREVRRRALLWAQWHNGHSCRTARQFVESLRGELSLLRTQGLPRGHPRRTPRAGSA